MTVNLYRRNTEALSGISLVREFTGVEQIAARSPESAIVELYGVDMPTIAVIHLAPGDFLVAVENPA